MSVRSIDKNDDWTFGRGKANYIKNSAAISQSVKTRLRSFVNDWFLDIGAGIPWLDLLGNLGTERRIIRAVERSVLQTDGVVQVTSIEIIRRDANRGVTIEVNYIDVFEAETRLTLEQTT